MLWPYVILFVLGLAVIGIVQGRSRRTPTKPAPVAPATGTHPTKPSPWHVHKWGWRKGWSNGKRPITFLLVFTALWIAFWMWMPGAPIFHTQEGWVHIATYYVLVGLAGLVDANLAGKQKFMAGVMLAIIFTIVGSRTAILFSPDGKGVTSWFHSTKTPATTTTSCSGTKEYVLNSKARTNINPGGTCAPDLFWPDGLCIYVQRAEWTGDSKVYTKCGVGKLADLPRDTEWAWSSIPLTLGVRLAPPRYN